MSSKKPEHLPDHVFQKGETVYVLDDNKYDIYAAEITEITDEGYNVYYPDYEVDELVTDQDRLFPKTINNNRIFNSQEKIRLQKEKQQEAKQKGESDYSESDSSESDGNFGSSSESDAEPKKPAKPKKEKVKKEKAPKKERVKKEKPERPKRQLKPKKEKKEKKDAKQKKKRDNDFVFIREAFQNGARNANEFVSYLETKYADREFHMDQLAKKFEDYVSQHQEGEVSDFQEDFYNDDDLNEPEEMPTFNEETIRIYKDIEETIPEADELILPSWISYNNPDGIMSINFTTDDDDNELCNAFLYTTDDDKKYLILNGQKLELKGEELLFDEFFYDKHPTRIDGLNPISQAAYTSVYKKKSFYKILKKPSDVEQMEANQRKRKKVKEAPITTQTDFQTKSSYSSRSRKETWDAKNLEEYSD